MTLFVREGIIIAAAAILAVVVGLGLGAGLAVWAERLERKPQVIIIKVLP